METDDSKIVFLKEMSYIAHVTPENRRKQLLSVHLSNVEKLSYENCPLNDLRNMVWMASVLHDAGKLSTDFQDYMNEILECGKDARRRQIDHSTAGGRLAEGLAEKSLAAKMIAIAIYSHHGLQDCISLSTGQTLSEIRRKNDIDYMKVSEKYCSFVNQPLFKQQFENCRRDFVQIKEKILAFVREGGDRKIYGNGSFFFGMYERLLLSVLIDSDWTDAACFSENIPLPKRIPQWEMQKIWDQCVNHFEKYMRQLKDSDEDSIQISVGTSPLNVYRQEISEICRDAAETGQSLYRLTVPTGAGKTLSSLRFALYHAAKFKKQHIFYIAPYHSILEQNARDIRKAVGKDVYVLEHHCNIVYDDSENDRAYQKLTERWDCPIIVTTAVQALNTLFSAQKSSIRRMYNMCNSVIIFDEVQAFPAECTELFHLAVNFLTAFCNTTVILCSATQPSLAKFSRNVNTIYKCDEMVGDVKKYSDAFKRTVIEDKTSLFKGGMCIEDLKQFTLEAFTQYKSVLIIVNTKSCARNTYEALKEDCRGLFELYHLSTNMCAVNRQEELDKISRSLMDKKPIICVSTQLVEAGVNLSFGCVIRSMAGLDSIIQAAGRCNRHKEYEQPGKVFIIQMTPEAERLSNLKSIRHAQDTMRKVLYQFRENPEDYDNALDSMKIVQYYYSKYFQLLTEENVTKYPVDTLGTNMVDLLSLNSVGCQQRMRSYGKKAEGPLNQAFKTAGEYFEVISDDEKISVVIPYDAKACEIIDILSDAHLSLEDRKIQMRRLQPYSVGISLQMKDQLGRAVYDICDGKILVLNSGYYDKKVGILASPQMETLIV